MRETIDLGDLDEKTYICRHAHDCHFGICVLAQGFNTGIRAAQAGGFAGSIAQWTPLAAQGDAAAAYNTGLTYARNNGSAPKDGAEALRWYRIAADQSHVQAQYRIGLLYNDGLGVTQDYAAAMQWYMAAAKQDNQLAQRNTGVMFYKGCGVAQDPVLAYMWTIVAIARGLNAASNNEAILVGQLSPDQIAKRAESAPAACNLAIRIATKPHGEIGGAKRGAAPAERSEARSSARRSFAQQRIGVRWKKTVELGACLTGLPQAQGG